MNKKMISWQKHHKGFTAVEILVVLAIISLISLISWPQLVNYQKTTKLKNEVNVLVTNLRLAQQLAVTEQIIYQVKLFSGTGSYQIINSKTGEVVKTITLDPEVTIQQINDLTDDTVQFNAGGGALEAGEVFLTNTKNATSSIQIKPSGYIQIID